MEPLILSRKPSSWRARPGPLASGTLPLVVDLSPYLAADASCDISHLDPVELSDVQVFTIERLYLNFHT